MKSSNRFLWGIFLVALVFRAVPVLLTWQLGIGLDDMFQYDMLARSIAGGQGFRWYAEADLNTIKPYINFDLTGYAPQGLYTSFRAPLYPLFLSGIYTICGMGAGRFAAARLAQAVIGAVLPVLTVLLARRMLSGLAVQEKAARAAGWAVALYPMLWVYPLALATENLFFPLLTASLLVLLLALDRPRPLLFFAAGVLFGLTLLTRSVVFFGVILVAAWIFFIRRLRMGAVILTIALFLTIAPWVIRNTALYGQFTWIETSMGYNLYVGYHPQSDGTFTVKASTDLLRILDDRQRDAAGMQAFRQFVAQNPARVPYLALRRLGFFFGLERRALTYFYANNFFGFIPLATLIGAAALLLLPFMGISISAALGVALRWGKGTAPALLVALGYLAPHIFILSEERFHMALIPILACLAARLWLGRSELAARWREPGGKVALLAAAGAICLLIFNWGAELTLDREKLAALFGPEGNKMYIPY